MYNLGSAFSSFLFTLFCTLLVSGEYDKDSCGRVDPSVVVNRTLPWHVSVYGGEHLICSGTLISNNSVLTQGMCGRSILEKTDKITVVLGNQIRSLNQVPEEFKRKVAHVVVAGDTKDDAESDDLDLSLLLLDIPAPKGMPHVCLPPSNHQKQKVAFVVVWEGEYKTGYVAKIQYRKECLHLAPGDMKPYISSDTFCLEPTDGLVLNAGSAGTGAYHTEDDGKWWIAGVLSMNGPPVIFYRISESSIEWIKSHMHSRSRRSLNPDLIHFIDL